MSLKDIFNAEQKKKNNLTTVNFQNLTSFDSGTLDVESYEFVKESNKDFTRFIPPVNYATASNFAKFGLAEQYYEDSIDRVINLYPFDGSLKEKKEWRNGSTLLDLYIFDNEYPKTTGFVNFASGGWGTQDSSYVGVGVPQNKEYIKFFNRAVDNKIENVYEPSAKRRENTRFIFSTGSTIEFWMKKNAYPSFAQTTAEVIFYSKATGSSARNYFTLYLENGSTNTIKAEYSTGAGINLRFDFEYNTGLATIADSNWHHYAFTYYSSSAGYTSEFYLDGVYKETKTYAGTIIDFTGSALCTIGAMGGPSYLTAGDVPLGTGKLSGSIDEFRFWNTRRNAKQIGRYYLTSEIGDGTNTDDANIDLGVHFKFNEGIVGNSSIDARVLDYSGRQNDGTFVGYSSSSRETGSAIDSAGFSEPKDPIIYLDNPTLASFKETKMAQGRTHDYSNNGSLYGKLPAFIWDEDSQNGFVLRKLTQIMASYLDQLYLQIQFLPKIKHIDYTEELNKPHNFYAQALENAGFPVVNLFADIELFNRYLSRDEKQLFEKDFEQIKNRIFQNIYNNLPYILKSKGNEKAFRNFIRCFGVDDEIYKLNLYNDNFDYEIQNRYKNNTINKNYINFNQLYNTDAVVYSYPDASNASSVGFISGTFDSTKIEENIANTYEIDVVFPQKPPINDPRHVEYSAVSASIFGVVTADSNNPTDTTIPANNLCNFELYAVRPESLSQNAYFVLKSSYSSSTAADNFVIQTNTIKQLYTDQRWNFAVRIVPQGYDLSDRAAVTSPTNYTLELYGVSVIGDYKVQEITASTTIGYDRGLALLSKPRRLYVGSTRTNVTGALLVGSDIKATSTKVWFDYLDNDTIYNNAIQANVDGNELPYKSAYVGQTQLNGVFIPKIDTLAVNWSFNQVYSSSVGGQFTVIDNSSGSAAQGTQRYGILGGIIKAQHAGRGDHFANDTKIVFKEYLPVLTKRLPEQVSPDDTVQILTQDDLVFTKESRPIRTFISIERSMYQTISEEMMKLMSSISQFSNFVGERQNQYRHEYKDMGKLRSLFFESIGNTPDLDKYVEYYKWLDVSLNKVIQTLFPASADVSEEVNTMIESHVLERSKYKWKFPTMEFKPVDLEAGLNTINKHLYNWKYGHAPIPLQEITSSLWWNKRAERNGPVLSSSNAGVNNDKTLILSASYQTLNRSFTTAQRFAADESKYFMGGTNLKNKKFDYYKPNKQSISVEVSNNVLAPNTTDYADLSTKFDIQSVVSVDGYKSRFALPFSYYVANKNAISGSIQNISTNKLDVYGPHYEIPLQGPFTEKYVGGNFHRHQQLFSSGSNRAEAYIISGSGTTTTISNPFLSNINQARSDFYRDGTAKRPVNIKNIAQTTGSTIIGNYDKKYHFFQTSDRNVNNFFFTSNNGIDSTGRADPYVSGNLAWTLPNRTRTETVFVERFSAPGDPLVMSEGALDAKSAQYSVYNALPFRNLNVRNALKTLLTIPSTAGGYQSGSSTTASFHKVPKNGYSNIAGSTNNDNFWIQHPIPQCDLKYKWIFDSATATSSCDSYSFTSASSLAKTDGSQLLQPVVYTDSNFYVIDPINTASNLLGIDGGNISSYINSGNGYYSLSSPGAFSALITKRNAGYGYPSWLQIRTSNHPLARVFKENNILSTVEPKKTNITPFRGGAIQSVSVDTITNYTETPMAENYPVKYNFVIENYKNGVLQTSNTPLKISYSNVKEYFNNIELNDKYINSNDLPKLAYDQVQELIKTKDSYSPIKSVEGFSYKEKLFPRKVNAYRGIVRGRTSYEETQSQKDSQDVVARRTFWKDNITDRRRTLGSLNSQGNTFFSITSQLTSSVYSLDYDFVSETYGELLKKTTYVLLPSYISGNHLVTASALYSAFTPSAVSFANKVISDSGINPFYDSYDDYSNDIRTIGKDYSVVPEFRISDHIPYFTAGGDLNFNSKILENFLKLDGASISASNQQDFYKVYSHTDFINNYATFESDLSETELSNSDKKIKIKLSAVKKLLPYNGFYPSNRLLQLAQLFSSSFSGTTIGGWQSGVYSSASYSGSSNYAPFFSLFFSPGIIFNTIKSGIAVDFPAHTGTVLSSSITFTEGVLKAPDYRVKFESCISLNKSNLVSNQPIGYAGNGGLFVSASWNGNKNNSLYELASNNFFGESIKFFLSGESTQTIASSKESEFDVLDENKTYYMDITLYKSNNFIMHEGPTSGGGKLAGAPYGPMYDPGTGGTFEDPSYASATPPYFYGNSSVRLSFKPSETRKYKLSEIFAGLTSSYSNSFGDVRQLPVVTGSAALSSVMRIDASINLLGAATLKQVVYRPDLTPLEIFDQTSDSGYDTWVISPKFETPIYNYRDKVTSGYSTGMWINYKGDQGNDDEGIFLEISDPFPQIRGVNNSTTGSLIDVLKFDKNKSSKKLGQVAETKEISEAIVAIPIDRNGNRYQISADTFKLLQNPDLVNAAKPFNPKPSRTLIDMYETMQKYVFPPHLDFVNNKSVRPFGMYIFEFTHTLTKSDLGKIWQGVMPEIATKMELDEQSIEHSFGPGEIFDRNFDDQTRWIVFKVKKKAENSYYNSVIGASQDTRFDFEFQIGNEKVSAQKSILPYSYNWPYDFFSLVELAKIDAEVTYKKKE